MADEWLLDGEPYHVPDWSRSQSELQMTVRVRTDTFERRRLEQYAQQAGKVNTYLSANGDTRAYDDTTRGIIVEVTPPDNLRPLLEPAEYGLQSYNEGLVDDSTITVDVSLMLKRLRIRNPVTVLRDARVGQEHVGSFTMGFEEVQ